MLSLSLDYLDGAGADGGADSCSAEWSRSLTSWIVPFTCGGFLNISLVTVLPDLMRQSADNAADTARVLGGIAAGVLTMAAVSSL